MMHCALWRGEPLADLADEPFAAAEIRRLEDLRLRATEMAIDADLAAGRYAELTGELDALVAEHALRERLHGQRMLALYRAGRQSEALEAYRAARAGLVEQIGVEPGAELQRLQEQILAQDPALDLPAAAETEPRAPPWRRSRGAARGRRGARVAGVLAFGIIRVLEPDSLAGIDEDHVGLIDPDGGRITAQYSVGHSPDAVAAGGGSVWVANRLDGTVSRIDRERQVRRSTSAARRPRSRSARARCGWRTVTRASSRRSIPARTRCAADQVANAPRSLALAEGALWVVSGADGDVHRVDLGHQNACARSPSA